MALTTLLNTIWVFNDTINVNSSFNYSVNFTYYGKTSSLQNFASHNGSSLSVVSNVFKYDTYSQYSKLKGWDADGNPQNQGLSRYIKFTGGTDIENASLITWISKNAKQISSQEVWQIKQNAPYDLLNFVSANFTSNNETFSHIDVRVENNIRKLRYDSSVLSEIEPPVVRYYNSALADQTSYDDWNYKSLNFASAVTDTTLLTWLNNNAIRLSTTNNLTNTKWEFFTNVLSDALINTGSVDLTFNINFICGDESFTSISLSPNISGSQHARWGIKFNNTVVFYSEYNEGGTDYVYVWNNEKYKNIIITGGNDASNEALIAWFYNVAHNFTIAVYEKIRKNGKKVQVDSAIRDGNGAKIDTNYAKKAELNSYVKTTELDTRLSDYSTTTQMNTAISAHHDTSKQDTLTDGSAININSSKVINVKLKTTGSGLDVTDGLSVDGTIATKTYAENYTDTALEGYYDKDETDNAIETAVEAYHDDTKLNVSGGTMTGDITFGNSGDGLIGAGELQINATNDLVLGGANIVLDADTKAYYGEKQANNEIATKADLATKQDTLSSGDGINIINNTVGVRLRAGGGINLDSEGAMGADLNNIVVANPADEGSANLSKLKVGNVIYNVPDTTYTEGDGIDITNNEISVNITGDELIIDQQGALGIDTSKIVQANPTGEGSGTLTKLKVGNQTYNIEGKTYTAGTNITISAQNVISATDTTYTAGDGIDINNTEISVNLADNGGLEIDANGLLRTDSTIALKSEIPTSTSDLDNDSGYITINDVPQEIFWVSYGTTTYAEIKTALTAGKLPICKYGDNYYILSRNLGDTSYCYFNTLTGTGAGYIQLNNTDSSWTYQPINLENASNKVTSLSSSSTNTQYPGALATYNAIINHHDSSKQNTLTDGDGINITNNTISVALKDNGGLAADGNGALYVDDTIATKNDIPTNVSELDNDSGYQTAANVSSSISSALTNYATKTYVDDATDDMATQTWVNAKGYITDVSGKLDKKTTTGLSAYTHNGTTQSEINIASDNATNSTLVQRTSAGAINTATPTADTHATTKLYVDTADTALDVRVQNLEARGRYLSGWNCTTGKPNTYPPVPSGQTSYTYTYKTGDYFVVTNATTGSATSANKKPSGTTVSTTDGGATWTISSVSDGGNVIAIGDYYIYDGNGTWNLIHTDTNTHRPIQMNGTEILGNNVNPLNLKAGQNITLSNSSGTVTVATDTAIPTKTSELTNDSGFITSQITSVNGLSGGTLTSALTITGNTYPATDNTYTIGDSSKRYRYIWGRCVMGIESLNRETDPGSNQMLVPNEQGTIASREHVASNYLALSGGNLTGSVTSNNNTHIQAGTSNVTGSNTATNYISAGIGYSNTSGREGVKIVCCDQSDCVSGLGQNLGSSSGKTVNGYNFSIAGCNNSSDKGSISFVTHVKGNTTYRELAYFDDNAGTVKFDVLGTMYQNGNAVATQSWVSNQGYITDVSGLLKLDGSNTMTGMLNLKASGANEGNIGTNGIRWNSTSLPNFSGTIPYFLGIESFADGGRTKWASASSIKISTFNNDAGYLTSHQSLENYVTTNTYQTITKPKIIKGVDSDDGTDQPALLKVLNTNNATTTSGWQGRVMAGSKNKTFLLGTYRDMCGIGAHSWTDSAAGTGAAWENFYLNPDGNKAVVIGYATTGWSTSDTGILKIDNSDHKAYYKGVELATTGNLSSYLPLNGGSINGQEKDITLVNHSNEFNFVPSNYSGELYLNYRPADSRSNTANVSTFTFLKGSGNTANYADIKAGTVYSNGSACLTSHQDISGKANLSGGNTFTGAQTFAAGTTINASGYVVANWFQTTATTDNASYTDFFVNSNGWLYKRSKANVISDLGINNKQDKLTAGNGIAISNNTISVGTGNGLTFETDGRLIVDTTAIATTSYVQANPSDSATSNISKIKIGSTVYNISGGSGGGLPTTGGVMTGNITFANDGDGLFGQQELDITAAGDLFLTAQADSVFVTASGGFYYNDKQVATTDDLSGKLSKTEQSSISVAGTTKNTTVLGGNTLVAPNGLVMSGTAASAGLVTRGICGVTVPSATGACSKDNLFINYDGVETYNTDRQMVLQAGYVGTHYGNNLYQYCVPRGDIVKAWVEAKGYLKTTDTSVCNSHIQYDSTDDCIKFVF